MLFTEINEQQSNFVYPNGYRHDDALDPIRSKLKHASLFVMDEQALAMTANVALTKPSSIVASLPFVNLPSPLTWIEYINLHVRQATADLGSPNIRPENAGFFIQRSGYLMYLDEDKETGRKDIIIEYVHKDRPFEGKASDGREYITDIAPVIGRFSLADTDEYRPDHFPAIPRDPNIPTSGKVRRYQEILDRNPEEAAALAELHSRFSWAPHPDLTALARSVGAMMGEDNVARIEEGQAGDLERAFLNQVLPALILLNCRNAVEREVVPAPEKLNKKRVQKGRPPIREYETVKVHLSGSGRRALAKHGSSFTKARDGGLVIGHFKVRKTGIFWWGFHVRGGGPVEPPPTRRVKVLTF